MASNAFRVGALALIGGLTLFLGKILVAMASGICAGLMIKNFPDHPEGKFEIILLNLIQIIQKNIFEFSKVNSLMVPIVTCSLIGYIVAVGFFSVFSTAVNTLLLCFCEGRRVRAWSKFIYFKREFESFQEYMFYFFFSRLQNQ